MTEAKPPTRLGKQELYDALSALGYTEEQLSDDQGKKLKRPILLEKLHAHQQGEEGLAVLSDVEENDDDVGVEVKPDIKESQNNDYDDDDAEAKYPDDSDPEELEIPNQNDPKWTQYVLGQFMEDEVDGVNPRVEGLRRVANELVGELVEEGCDLVSAPSQENNFRACVKAWGIFLTANGHTKRFEALADAHADNCHEDYATYLVAMADTRAKGRVFRNALYLRRVVSAEEVSKTMAMTADIQKGGAIHTSQISMIRLISDRHNFNITEVLDGLGIKYELNDSTGDVNLKLLSYEDALAVSIKMREMKEEQEKK
jgi:hypothetical protein